MSPSPVHLHHPRARGAATTAAFASPRPTPQYQLVQQLQMEGIIKHDQVAAVMQQVDRVNYVTMQDEDYSYDDSPQAIDCGQTISAPHMHAYALEYLLPILEPTTDKKTDPETTDASEMTKVLDVGCGSGYLTAAFGRWVHPRNPISGQRILTRPGKVYGYVRHSCSNEIPSDTVSWIRLVFFLVYRIDVHPRLVDLTRANIQKADGDLLESGTVTLRAANGWNGWPEEAPFDAIHVGAAAEEFPSVLAKQLKVGGRMIVPIGDRYGTQYLYQVDRIKKTGEIAQDFVIKRLLGVRYVPLIRGSEAQRAIGARDFDTE